MSSLLRAVTDHLMGIRRPNFRRLFLATCRGERCPELDRFGIKPMPCNRTPSDTELGYWLPMYTWPIVRKLFKDDHLHAVSMGSEQPLSMRLQPSQDGEWSVLKLTRQEAE